MEQEITRLTKLLIDYDKQNYYRIKQLQKEGKWHPLSWLNETTGAVTPAPPIKENPFYNGK